MDDAASIRDLYHQSGHRFLRRYLAYVRTHTGDFTIFEAEHANILAAMDWCSRAGDASSLTEYADAVGNLVGGYLCVRGYWEEAIDYGQRALEVA